MDPIPAEDFAAVVDGSLSTPPTAGTPTVRRATIHSDRISRGSAFFALPGAHTDGHAFVERAFQNGAVLAVVARERVESMAIQGKSMVAVDDPLQSLQRLAEWWRSQLRGRVIAVAGSTGKTVTKDALVHFAGYKQFTYGSPGSYNSQIGVPLAILDCPRESDLAVIEVAASRPGEMSQLEQIVRPDCVVVTNIGTRWEASFRDKEHQARELLSIARGVSATGWVVLGEIDHELSRLARTVLDCPQLVQNHSGDLPKFSAPEHSAQQLKFRADFPDGAVETIAVRTESPEILVDVQTALSAAWLLGRDRHALIAAVEEYRPTSTRMEIWRSPEGGITLVRDMATPDATAVGAAIRTARSLVDERGRTFVVLAEPLSEWDRETTESLARVLVAEQAHSVYGLKISSHQALAIELEELGVLARARLFESTAELRAHLLNELHYGDVVLAQSPPSRGIRDASVDLVDAMRDIRLYIDLTAYEANVTAFRRILGPTTRLLAVVKASVYGVDDRAQVHISSCLQNAGVDWLAVDNADEGAALRRAGINVPILLLLGTGSQIEKMLRYRLTPVLNSWELLDAALKTTAGSSAQPFPVHLAVNSGMNVGDFRPEDAVDVLQELRHHRGVRLEGMMTHFSDAENPQKDHRTREQLALFEGVVRAAEDLGFKDVIRHAAATAATARFPESHLDMVRIGLGIHGIHPSPATHDQIRLVPAMTLVSRIRSITHVPEGEALSYGGTHVVERPGGAMIAAVEGGYHDTVPRVLSNVGYAIVAGVRCPMVGNILMSSMDVDVSECPEAYVGADVLIYGRQGTWHVPIEDAAALAGTIPYELMARIGSRVERIFTRH